jgi:YfiH family protein
VTDETIDRLSIDDFANFGVEAFTTTRQAGSFGLRSSESVGEVFARWERLQHLVHPRASRLVVAEQVHATRVIVHRVGWEGWLRCGPADGHATFERGTAMAVSVADCVPVFIAHASGAAAVLHSGWKGTARGILPAGIELLRAGGLDAGDLRIHLGPSICGRCYEVGPDVFQQVTGRSVERPTPVDLRARLAEQAERAGVRRVTISQYCTRCDNTRLFSHRCGDEGRQLGVIVSAH